MIVTVLYFRSYLLFVVLNFLHLHSTNLQRQAKQCDESACVMVVIEITGGEGCQRFIVQAVRRSGSGFDDIAFVKLEFYFTGYIPVSYTHLDVYKRQEKMW